MPTPGANLRFPWAGKNRTSALGTILGTIALKGERMHMRLSTVRSLTLEIKNFGQKYQLSCTYLCMLVLPTSYLAERGRPETTMFHRWARRFVWRLQHASKHGVTSETPGDAWSHTGGPQVCYFSHGYGASKCFCFLRRAGAFVILGPPVGPHSGREERTNAVSCCIRSSRTPKPSSAKLDFISDHGVYASSASLHRHPCEPSLTYLQP